MIKIKGVAKDQVDKITLKDLKSLLIPETSIAFNQDKWFKRLFDGDIEVVKLAYELKATSNKF